MLQKQFLLCTRSSAFSKYYKQLQGKQTYHSLHLWRWSAYNVGVVIEHCVLNHGSKDEQETDGHKQIHGRYVGDSGQGVPGHCAQGGHCQHCGDTCKGNRKNTAVKKKNSTF